MTDEDQPEDLSFSSTNFSTLDQAQCSTPANIEAAAKLVDYDDTSSSSSSSDNLNFFALDRDETDANYELWREEELWLLKLEKKDCTPVQETPISSASDSSAPVLESEEPQDGPCVVKDPQSFIFEASLQASILKRLDEGVTFYEHVCKVGQNINDGDLWTYAIESRSVLDMFCNLFKIDKPPLPGLDEVDSLLSNLKKRSLDDNLQQDRNKIDQAKSQVKKLKTVLTDVFSTESLLRKNLCPTNIPLEPNYNYKQNAYEPYRANLIVFQPRKDEKCLPLWLIQRIHEDAESILSIGKYFSWGLKVYYKSTAAAKDIFNNLISNERIKQEKIYIGRPSRGGEKDVWKDLNFVARIKTATPDLERDWFVNGTFDKDAFLEFFFKANQSLVKEDWELDKLGEASAVTSIYFKVALRTFDALKPFTRSKPLTLVVYKNNLSERVLGVYNLIACYGCLNHGHYIYDCKNISRCSNCLFFIHKGKPCKKVNICPHCEKQMTQKDSHSPFTYACEAYMNKGLQLQKKVKEYNGGY